MQISPQLYIVALHGFYHVFWGMRLRILQCIDGSTFSISYNFYHRLPPLYLLIKSAPKAPWCDSSDQFTNNWFMIQYVTNQKVHIKTIYWGLDVIHGT